MFDQQRTSRWPFKPAAAFIETLYMLEPKLPAAGVQSSKGTQSVMHTATCALPGCGCIAVATVTTAGPAEVICIVYDSG